MGLNFVTALWQRVRKDGVKKPGFKLEQNGEYRHFDAYEDGEDTLLCQRDAMRDIANEARRPCMIIRKSDLRIGRTGNLFIACTGSFSSALIPLFSGKFGPSYCRVSKAKRSEVLQHRVVLANLTPKSFDLLQRDTDFELIVAADKWLQKHGLGLDQIRFLEHSDDIVKYTASLGQLWRMRPSVFTLVEMRTALMHCWQSMESEAHYYVSHKGVYYLTYWEFRRLAELARTSPKVAAEILREWCAISPGQKLSRMRRPKIGTQHVIEFFGVPRPFVERLLIPSLERTLEGVTLGRLEGEDIADTLLGLAQLFHRGLTDPAFASEENDGTINALYLLVSAEKRSDGATINFDMRRMAIPGVTIEGSKLSYHPGVDQRTRTIIDHLLHRLSLNEKAESINLFEIRSAKDLTTSTGRSREILLKTDRQPLAQSFIEKRLGSVRAGYASYVLARANVFKALGTDYPTFELLQADEEGRRRESPYFIRTRCPGEPLDSIDERFYRIQPDDPDSPEDPDVMAAMANLYGTVAAQNFTVKKYIQETRSCRFGQGKEIFEFTYDPFKKRPMPNRIHICSIRGALGWPNREQTEINLVEAYRFYMRSYAKVLSSFWRLHPEALTLAEIATAFFDGFEQKMQSMRWTYRHHKVEFDTFDPGLKPAFQFRQRLDFALWAFDNAPIDAMRDTFLDAVRDTFIKVQ